MRGGRRLPTFRPDHEYYQFCFFFFFSSKKWLGKLGVVTCEISGRQLLFFYQPSSLNCRIRKGRDRTVARRSFHSIKKVGVAKTVACQLVSILLMVMPLPRSISQKPHNWLQPSEGKQCCKFGLLYSMDEFMLLLQDKLQGGTESGIRTIESFLGFSMKENQLQTRHWEMATIFVNACREME